MTNYIAVAPDGTVTPDAAWIPIAVGRRSRPRAYWPDARPTTRKIRKMIGVRGDGRRVREGGVGER